MQLHYLICLASSHTSMHQNYFKNIITLHVCSALDCSYQVTCLCWERETPRKGVINVRVFKCPYKNGICILQKSTWFCLFFLREAW